MGIFIAVWLGDKRFRSHGENLDNVVADVAIWAVPFGIVGGRLYTSLLHLQVTLGKMVLRLMP